MVAAPLLSTVGGVPGREFFYILCCFFLVYIYLPFVPALVTGTLCSATMRRLDPFWPVVIGFAVGVVMMVFIPILVFGYLLPDTASFLKAPGRVDFPPIETGELVAQSGGAAVGAVITWAICWVWHSRERRHNEVATNAR